MYVYMMSSLMFIKKPMKRKPRLLVLIDLHVETVTLYRILFGAADEGFPYSMTSKTNSAICLLNLSGSLNNSCFFLQYFNYDLNKKNLWNPFTKNVNRADVIVDAVYQPVVSERYFVLLGFEPLKL